LFSKIPLNTVRRLNSSYFIHPPKVTRIIQKLLNINKMQLLQITLCIKITKYLSYFYSNFISQDQLITLYNHSSNESSDTLGEMVVVLFWLARKRIAV
jgi:hypothetical protein